MKSSPRPVVGTGLLLEENPGIAKLQRRLRRQRQPPQEAARPIREVPYGEREDVPVEGMKVDKRVIQSSMAARLPRW